MIHEKIQKNRKMLKKMLLFSAATWIAFFAEKILKFNFLYSWKSCRELNFLSKKKKKILNQLEFWVESYSQNTKEVRKITQIQHHLQFSFKISNGVQHQICTSLSNRLIPTLSFRRKLLKNKLNRKTYTFYEKSQKTEKCSKNVTIFSNNLNCIFSLGNI